MAAATALPTNAVFMKAPAVITAPAPIISPARIVSAAASAFAAFSSPPVPVRVVAPRGVDAATPPTTISSASGVFVGGFPVG
jgi:hypothetical protein